MGIRGIKVKRPWGPLTKDEISDIHLASLEILEKIGMAFPGGGQVLKLYEEAGANVEYKHKRVMIPPHIVENAIRKAPRRITLCGRNPEYNIKLEDRRVYFTVCAEALSVRDVQTDTLRPATKKDLADLSRLADALDYCAMIPSVCPQDVPQAVWIQHAVEAILNNSEKHVTYVATPNGEAAKEVIKIAAAVSGGEDELRRKPLLSGACQFTSPLMCMSGIPEVMIEFAKRGIPIDVGSVPLAGATSPVTLAGTLAQMNAEVLAGLVLVQSVNPGTPFIYGSVAPCIMDMKTGNVSIGCPEKGLMSPALAQLTQYYGLPNLIDGFSPDSKFNDIQAGYERTVSVLTSALAGSNMIMGAGLLQWGDICCYKAYIIDNEILGYVYRILKGINVTDETLAVNLINKVGPGGNFLSQRHTLIHLKEEHFIPELTDRERRSTWEKQGSKSLEQRAKERAIKLLETHYPEPLDRDIQQEITKIVKEAEKREAV